MEQLREYVGACAERTRLDAAAGVLRQVKVLGQNSRNGRSYPEATLRKAAPLYEGAKVNVNHPKGMPDGPRDYQERIGTIKNVVFRPSEGIFADLHFNPRHALAEQLIWDATHAPENVGLSHNVRARLERSDEAVVVREISDVVSVDLVADPATTRGLFESRQNVTTDANLENANRQIELLQAEVARCRRQLDISRRIHEETTSYRVERHPPLAAPNDMLELLAAVESDDLRERLVEAWVRLTETIRRTGAAAMSTVCESREQTTWQEEPPRDAAAFVRAIT